MGVKIEVLKESFKEMEKDFIGIRQNLRHIKISRPHITDLDILEFLSVISACCGILGVFMIPTVISGLLGYFLGITNLTIFLIMFVALDMSDTKLRERLKTKTNDEIMQEVIQ